jgi:hydrogenase nickel incorporation protein HypA/HybF
MHELGIALQVVETVTERAGLARVRKVVLHVGVLTAVLPESLRFCFDLATAGTLAEGALLEIVERPGLARCRACGADVELLRPFGRCLCGGSDLDWLAGDELEISSMEVV